MWHLKIISSQRLWRFSLVRVAEEARFELARGA